MGKCQPRGMLMSRGGNGWDVDQIVPFRYPFYILKQISMQIWIFSNMNMELMLLEYGCRSDVFSIQNG
jgi:hypothetical protein